MTRIHVCSRRVLRTRFSDALHCSQTSHPPRGWEDAQSDKLLLYKPEDLSVVPSAGVDKPRVMAHTGKPSAGKVKTGDSLSFAGQSA